MSDYNTEVVENILEESLNKSVVSEGNMKGFVMALSRHERALSESSTIKEIENQLNDELADIIDSTIAKIRPVIGDMISASQEADTNETAKTAKELRKSFGAMVASGDVEDVTVAESKTKATREKVLRTMTSAVLDNLSARYAKA